MENVVPDTPDDVHVHLAARLRSLRAARCLTLEALAERTGVSRSMISLIERAESSPTAAVLARLAGGLGVSLASLFGEAERSDASPLARRDAQRVWRDPESGYLRRNLSPAGHPSPIELAEVILPAGARVAYGAGPRFIGQQIWLLEGRLALSVGREIHELSAGDCLAMRVDQPTVFFNPGERPARYLVAFAADAGRGATGPAGGRSNLA
jgi:transcriptional regulator with XRE-family HTH domain